VNPYRIVGIEGHDGFRVSGAEGGVECVVPFEDAAS